METSDGFGNHSEQKSTTKSTTGGVGMRKQSKSSGPILKATIRQAKALELRLQRKSLQTIADTLGFADRSGALKAIQKAIADLGAAENAEELRQQSLLMLDKLQAACWDEAMEGDPKAINTAVRLIEARAKLAGIEPPTRHEVTGVMGGAIAVAPLSRDEITRILQIHADTLGPE